MFNIKNNLTPIDTGNFEQQINTNVQKNESKAVPHAINRTPKDLVMEILINNKLSVSNKNIDLLLKLMNNNIPLDKETIKLFMKFNLKYDDLDTVIEMYKNNLEINDTNINEFHNFLENNNIFINDFTNLIKKNLQNGSKETIQKIIKFLLNDKETNEVNNNETPSNTENKTSNSIEQYNDKTNNIKQSNNILESKIEEIKIIKNTNSETTNTLESKSNNDISNTSNTKNTLNFDNKQITQNVKIENNYETKLSNVNDNTNKNLTQNQQNINTDNSIDKLNALDKINPILKDIFKNDFKIDNLSIKDFNKLIINKLYLKPEEISDKEVVKNHIQKLQNLLSTLNNGENGEVCDRLFSNLSFMKTLNEIYPYIQLPVLINEQGVNSDLHFIKKKKDLDVNNLMAMLHLSTNNLGIVDVHIKKLDNSLNLKLYVEDIDLFNANKHHLENLLQEFNYNLSLSFYKKDSISKTPLKQILDENKPKTSSGHFETQI